jgi:hypothetical protein
LNDNLFSLLRVVAFVAVVYVLAWVAPGLLLVLFLLLGIYATYGGG